MTLSANLRRCVLGGALLASSALRTQAQHGGRGPGGLGGGPGGPGGGNPGAMGSNPNGDFGNRGPGGGGFGGNSAAPRTGLQLAPPGRWWNDKRVARSLNLRADQQHRMDDILAANKGTLIGLYSNLKHEEDRLTSMSREDLQDEGKVFAGIDRVAQARADLEKANAHTLLQIRKELDAQQLAELDREVAPGR